MHNFLRWRLDCTLYNEGLGLAAFVAVAAVSAVFPSPKPEQAGLLFNSCLGLLFINVIHLARGLCSLCNIVVCVHCADCLRRETLSGERKHLTAHGAQAGHLPPQRRLSLWR